MYETGLGEEMALRAIPAIVDDEDQANLTAERGEFLGSSKSKQAGLTSACHRFTRASQTDILPLIMLISTSTPALHSSTPLTCSCRDAIAQVFIPLLFGRLCVNYLLRILPFKMSTSAVLASRLVIFPST